MTSRSGIEISKDVVLRKLKWWLLTGRAPQLTRRAHTHKVPDGPGSDDLPSMAELDATPGVAQGGVRTEG